MPDVFVGLGSNVEPVRHLHLAVDALRERFGRLVLSSVYRSPAYGFAGADFLNMVAGFTSLEGADRIEAALHAIEYAGGRTRDAARYTSRALDLDLLLVGASVDAARRLPRDDISRYPFVAVPLADIAPHLVHPLTGQRFERIAQAMRAGSARLERLGQLERLRD